ncbi:MAG TPA: hypothetical protein VD790_03880 [Thermoleophilaceae bacterium]|nr:hypothetical protein [Thermoleophilaceae bacterium]
MAAVALTAAIAATPAAAKPPRFDQLVVFPNGDAATQTVRAKATRVRTARRRCRVPRATPLAALVRSRVPKVRVRDFSGTCDPASLFVRSIAGRRNLGQRGWVYKVGNRQGTTAASDPAGPFGSGRITRRARVIWFYCVFGEGGCQRTLGLRVREKGDGSVSVRATAYDDEGRGAPVKNAAVRSGDGDVLARTDAQGRASLDLDPGRHRLHVTKRGHIRSFDQRVRVD